MPGIIVFFFMKEILSGKNLREWKNDDTKELRKETKREERIERQGKKKEKWQVGIGSKEENNKEKSKGRKGKNIWKSKTK